MRLRIQIALAAATVTALLTGCSVSDSSVPNDDGTPTSSTRVGITSVDVDPDGTEHVSFQWVTQAQLRDMERRRAAQQGLPTEAPQHIEEQELGTSSAAIVSSVSCSDAAALWLYHFSDDGNYMLCLRLTGSSEASYTQRGVSLKNYCIYPGTFGGCNSLGAWGYDGGNNVHRLWPGESAGSFGIFLPQPLSCDRWTGCVGESSQTVSCSLDGYGQYETSSLPIGFGPYGSNRARTNCEHNSTWVRLYRNIGGAWK